MSQDELAVMDGSKCILQIRGVRPFLSNKFDITKHDNYKLLSDYNEKNTFSIEEYIERKLRTKPSDMVGIIISPCEDIDLSQSEQYWTELAENLINEYRSFPDTHSGYDRYTPNSSVSSLTHDTYKLLAYLSVVCKDEKGVWNFERAKSEIESIFSEQYELYSQEAVELRKNVTTTTDTDWGASFWIPDEYATYSTPNGVFNSMNYNDYANGGTQILITYWTNDYTV